MHGYRRIRKYLLILASFFIVVLLAHLGILYVFVDGKIYPQEGGTVSIGIVNATPSLNPIYYGENPTRDFILQFLYRSLLRYDNPTKQMEGDIANCDLGPNFLKMKCFLKKDLKWSNGNAITKEDILQTYAFYKESGENTYLKELLKNIDIKDTGEYLEFSAKSADVLLLDIFTLPVLPGTQIQALADKTKKIEPEALIVSGAFKVEKEESEKNTGSTKINLVYNPSYTEKSIYIKKYTFRFFESAPDLLKNEDILNGIIFHPNDTTQAPSSPRFEKYQYLYPQYISLFLNSESLHLGMRQIILNSLNQATYTSLNPEQGSLIGNPFLGKELPIIGQPKESLERTLGALGYFKKSSLLSEIQKKQNPTTKSGATTSVANNQYLISPTKQKTYVTLAKPEIIIAGEAPAGVEAVYINSYKLTSFVPGNTKFYYKASPTLKNLAEGKNTYALSFLINKKKVYKETLTIYVEKDETALKARQAEIDAANKKTTESAPKQVVINIQEAQNKIAALEDVYYYDTNFNKFSLSLSYTKSSDTFVSLANQIQKELRLVGIDLVLKEIADADLSKMVNNNEKNYDMLLVGVSNGLFDYNISPYFHSSQAKNGYNFSKVKDLQLDGYLETLKSGKLEEEKLTFLKKEIIKILGAQAVSKTFYSPYNNFFIDRNIRELEKTPIIPSKAYLYEVLESGYIKINRVVDWKTKSVFGFMRWLVDNFK